MFFWFGCGFGREEESLELDVVFISFFFRYGKDGCVFIGRREERLVVIVGSGLCCCGVRDNDVVLRRGGVVVKVRWVGMEVLFESFGGVGRSVLGVLWSWVRVFMEGGVVSCVRW